MRPRRQALRAQVGQMLQALHRKGDQVRALVGRLDDVEHRDHRRLEAAENEAAAAPDPRRSSSTSSRFW